MNRPAIRREIYAGSVKFNGIPTEENTEIPVNTCIDSIITWLVIVCGVFSIYQTLENKRRSGIIFLISNNFLWIKWDNTFRASIRSIKWISTWFRIWNVQECIWVSLYQMVYLRSYCKWFWWHQFYSRSMPTPRKPLSMIHKMLWGRLWTIWRVSNSIFVQGVMLYMVVLKYW